MLYELFLRYEQSMTLGPDRHLGDVCDINWARIMHWAGETDADINDEEDEGSEIGTLNWYHYNQALAIVHGINMSQVPMMRMQYNKEALLELDYTHISQETINEIGAASNPNIILISHFAIEAAYRNKGLGEKVLKGFIEQMTGKCGYIVINNNVPAQLGEHYSSDPADVKERMSLESLEQDPEKAQYKLNAFWQRCGFKPFKNYENVFICNVDQAVREFVKPKIHAT